MDHALEYADEHILDNIYGQTFPTWARDYWLRQYISICVMWTVGGILSYLIISGLSYYYLFDKSARKDKRFLKNQELLEIKVSLISIPLMALPSAFIFLGEIRGHSKLYEGIDGVSGWAYAVFSVVIYLLFTDTMIYWIHWAIHLPSLYPTIHKLHHKWIVPTPFASFAFHPADGFAQSLPYHVFAYFVPLNKFLYLGLFLFVCTWTVSIHDGKGYYYGSIINGADHHTIHHSDFKYNYGQYFTFWDRIMGTHRLPGHSPNSPKNANAKAA
eukprot:TRINITY_DN14549_c0_g1_i1.p1 TRINITY_DN14549_c0_g1~~TRINITY_DN14549_c0_g1_i1.p1  ORF type:complete len:271 (-),score=58.31 TRINITY_DN14549_c0_g1_i1:102-914(-)